MAENPDVTLEVNEAFSKVRSTTDDYLQYKTEQRGAQSPETIKAKNDYEQGHIDLAMDLKKAADAFFTAGRSHVNTSNKEEMEALQANLARRALETAKENPQPQPEQAPVL